MKWLPVYAISLALIDVAVGGRLQWVQVHLPSTELKNFGGLIWMGKLYVHPPGEPEVKVLRNFCIGQGRVRVVNFLYIEGND